LSLAGAAAWPSAVSAQAQAPAKAAPPKSSPPAPKQQTSPTAQQAPVSIEQALYLIRSALMTLNDANRTGNYTVLRDLAAPGFQERNTAANLALIFSDLRNRNFDLGGAAILAPQLSAAPALDADGMLRLTGFFPTRPLQINFDLKFQVVANQWRIFGIAITTPPAPPVPPEGAPGARKE